MSSGIHANVKKPAAVAGTVSLLASAMTAGQALAREQNPALEEARAAYYAAAADALVASLANRELHAASEALGTAERLSKRSRRPSGTPQAQMIERRLAELDAQHTERGSATGGSR